MLLFGVANGHTFSEAQTLREAVALLYVSLQSDALVVSSDVGYESPIAHTQNFTFATWVNDTVNPTTSKPTTP